jgi:hypothetical protein
MTTTRTGSVAWSDTMTVPVDSPTPDDVTAAVLVSPLGTLQDNCAYLKSHHDALVANSYKLVSASTPVAGGAVAKVTDSATFVDVDNATVDISLAGGDWIEGVVGPIMVNLSDAVVGALQVVITPAGHSPTTIPVSVPSIVAGGQIVMVTLPIFFVAQYAVSHNIKLQVESNGSDFITCTGYGDATGSVNLLWLTRRIWRPST